MDTLALRQHAVRVLEARLGRGTAALAGTAYVSFRNRALCRVSDVGAGYAHFYDGGVIVNTAIGGSNARQLEAQTRDLFLGHYTPGPGDVVLDVGAGIGGELLTFSRLIGDTGRLISIEAHPASFSCLAEAVRLNGLQNVTPLHAAVSDRIGTLTISDHGGADIGNSVLTSGPGISVPAVTLDAVVEQEQLGRVDFLKANIEGAEALMIQGMEAVVPLVRHAAIACHDFVADETGDESFRTRDQVRAYFEEHGFTVTTREDARPWARDTLYAHRP